MILIRWVLAIVTIAYAAFNTIAPVWTCFYKFKTDWPAQWMTVDKALRLLGVSAGGLSGGRFEALMRATNWVQVGMWLVADVLYIVAGLDLLGRRPTDAVSSFAVALLLDRATWLTFKRLSIYNLTVSQREQQLDLAIFTIMAGVGIFIWLSTQPPKPKQIQPSGLIE